MAALLRWNQGFILKTDASNWHKGHCSVEASEIENGFPATQNLILISPRTGKATTVKLVGIVFDASGEDLLAWQYGNGVVTLTVFND